MTTLCSTPETTYLKHIQFVLSNIKTEKDESNLAKIAFIIAAAISSKFNQFVDQEQIVQLLMQKTQNKRPVSYLDIKQVFNSLGFSVDAIKSDNKDILNELSQYIFITQDSHNNYIANIASSDSKLYFIYGKFGQDAIICSLNRSLFLRNFTNNKFLILND
ncbi:hypothetical protein [Acinetobacter defluvii]|uniref:hypothetical protein n=1 Tax=Acinetobacter defluvii TaxID=1871111 RepID=UPI003AF8F031